MILSGDPSFHVEVLRPEGLAQVGPETSLPRTPWVWLVDFSVRSAYKDTRTATLSGLEYIDECHTLPHHDRLPVRHQHTIANLSKPDGAPSRGPRQSVTATTFLKTWNKSDDSADAWATQLPGVVYSVGACR